LQLQELIELIGMAVKTATKRRRDVAAAPAARPLYALVWSIGAEACFGLLLSPSPPAPSHITIIFLLSHPTWPFPAAPPLSLAGLLAPPPHCLFWFFLHFFLPSNIFSKSKIRKHDACVRQLLRAFLYVSSLPSTQPTQGSMQVSTPTPSAVGPKRV
jgi:hypothetical protein